MQGGQWGERQQAKQPTSPVNGACTGVNAAAHPPTSPRHAWSAFFARQHEDRLAAYDGSGPPPENFNSEGRRRWWSAPGRTLTWVLDHIANGNNPPLAMPPPPQRPNRGPRCSPSSSSSSRSSASPRFSPYGSPSPRYLALVKDERESPRRRSSGGPVICGDPGLPSGIPVMHTIHDPRRPS
jgi:hypothetical protein